MNDNTENYLVEPAAPVAVTEISPGTLLSQQRRELGLSVEDVASRLNLAPRQIVAIEENNFGALPGMASTRGFIRAYGKLLKLDVGPLIAALALETDPVEAAVPLRRPLTATSFSPGRDGLAHRNRSSTTFKLGAAIMAVVAVGVLLAYQAGMLPLALDPVAVFSSANLASAPVAPVAGQRNAASDQVSAPNAAVSTPQSESTNANASAAAAPVSAALVQSPAHEQVSSAPVMPAASTVVAPVAQTATAPAATSAGTAQSALSLKAIQDCWIEIRRADNSLILSRTVKAGSVESFDVPGSVTLVLGNAAGVEVSLRGKALNVQANAKNNVARLELK